MKLDFKLLVNITVIYLLLFGLSWFISKNVPAITVSGPYMQQECCAEHGGCDNHENCGSGVGSCCKNEDCGECCGSDKNGVANCKKKVGKKAVSCAPQPAQQLKQDSPLSNTDSTRTQ